MPRTTFLASIFSALTALPAAAQDDDWIPLFDGISTKGWTPRSEVIKFEATNNKELHLYSKTNCWVTTEVKMDNFIVEAEVMLPEDALEVKFNSGLAFRCTGEKGKPKGYQCEIDGAVPGKSGGIYGIGLGGWLYPKKNQNAEYNERVKGLMKPVVRYPHSNLRRPDDVRSIAE